MDESPARDTLGSLSRRNTLMRKIVSMFMALALLALPALAADAVN
jgi:hypothetical protein